MDNTQEIDEKIEIKEGLNNYEQSGGFAIIGFILLPFVEIVKAIARFLKSAMLKLFHLKVWNLPQGKGLFWRYLFWCFKVSVFLAIFCLGGFGVTFIGIIYIYVKLYKKLKTPPNQHKDKENELSSDVDISSDSSPSNLDTEYSYT
jgi:hypothetical protein